MSKLSEDQWVQIARVLVTRPPMPWFVLNDMSQEDLRSIYRFVRQLGREGQPAPAYVSPTAQPNGPYISFPRSDVPDRSAIVR